NKNRASRVEQLTNDISNMQQHVLDELNEMDKMDAHMNDLIKEILHQNNLQTIVNHVKNISDDTSQIFYWTLNITGIAYTIQLGIPVYSVFKSGTVSFVCRTYFNAFRLIVNDLDLVASKRLLDEIRPLANAVLKEGSEPSQVLAKISKIARVIDILGLVVTVAKLKQPPEVKDEIMKSMIEDMVKHLNEDLQKVTCRNAYDNLMHKNQESHAWTNEDPNYQDTLQYIQDIPELKEISD
ncbi:12555_t:CDS:2, partial [Gigaspora rosea]